MEMFDPWLEIRPANESDSLNLRRADAAHPLDYWFAKDVRGRYLFCFDTSVNELDRTALPKLAGVEVISLSTKPGASRLVLTLLDNEQFDIFRALCSDLMRSTSELTRNDSRAGLAIILNRLERWQNLLERARDNLLSQGAIIGLVGELLFLRDLLVPRLDMFDAVQSWRGPFGDEQDFLLPGRIIEVKTQLSTSDRYLVINSEQQLDTSSGPILLCHQTLDVPANQEDGALSLNALVTSLARTLVTADYQAAGQFQAALLESGYQGREEYDRPFWSLNDRSFFEVRSGFPRIVANMIGAGIDNVRYRIALPACVDYKIEENSALERALDGR